MSDGANIYSMITGLGDGFSSAYAGARKRVQEEEAPTLINNLVNAYQGGQPAPASMALGSQASADAPAANPVAPPTFVGLSGANPSAARKMSGTSADFVSAMLPHALEASKATGVDPRIILAQSALETGFGRSAPGNNYFGIKSHGAPGGNTMATTEVVDGQPVRVNDSFRAFPSMAESAAGYADFLNTNPRYAGLKQAQGLEGQAAALQASGYATDPNYGAKVLSIARRLPAPGAGAPPAAAPVQVADNEARTQALEQRMGMVPPSPAPAVASADPDAADKPVVGAQPTGFVLPGQAPAAAPAQGFPGFGSTASRMTPAQSAALTAAWKNPETRPMATAIYGQMLKGQDSAWSLSTMGDQPVLFNARTAQVVPIGQAKRSTATVGNAIIDTSTGQPIYTAPEKESDKLTSVAPGTTLYDPRARQPVFTAPAKDDKDEGAKITAQIDARKQQAAGLGLVEGTPAWQSFVGTGKIGRDQDLSATDKKAILEADEKVMGIQGTLTALSKAKELSKDAYSGPLASQRGYLGSIIGLEGAEKTQELDNTITAQALDSLKATFGAAPTEGERKILLDIQGSSSQSPTVRAAIYARAEQALQKRLAFEQARADDLRGGTFYKKGQNAAAPAGAAVPKGEARTTIPGGKSAGMALAEARQFVKDNPGMKAQAADRLRSWGIDPKRLDD